MTTNMQMAPQHGSGQRDAAPDWDDVLADIGDRIRAERKARGWSQTELGLRTGLSLNTVKRMENGNTTLRGFVAACSALEVGIGELLAGEWQMPALRPSLTPFLVRVLRAVAESGSPAAAASGSMSRRWAEPWPSRFFAG